MSAYRQALLLICCCLIGSAAADPLDNWTTLPSLTRSHLRAVAFGAGVFVATGDSATILTSSNAIDWIVVASGGAHSLLGIAYGRGKFVAVGGSGAIVTSTDAVTWVPRSSGISNQLNAVAFGGSGFVAVGDDGSIVASSDGSNWVGQASNTSERFAGVGNGFGTTFAGTRGNAPSLYLSSNGSAWSSPTNAPLSSQPQLFNGGFAYGSGMLLGVLSRGKFSSSTDGINWTNRQSPFFYCFGIVYARSMFVTVGGNFGDGSAGRTIGSSTDGLNWQPRYSKTNEARLLAVTYGQHRFVAVGDSGSIVVSAPLLWLSNASIQATGIRMQINGEPGGVYHILRATNLPAVSWTEIGVVTNSAEASEFIAPLSPNSDRGFYRAASQ